MTRDTHVHELPSSPHGLHPTPPPPHRHAQAHEDRNLARQLTPAEKSEKKLRKLLDDNGAKRGGGDELELELELKLPVQLACCLDVWGILGVWGSLVFG
jgi:hypothetical protein